MQQIMFMIGLSVTWFFSTYLVFDDGEKLTGFQRGFIGGAPVACMWLAAIVFQKLQGQ